MDHDLVWQQRAPMPSRWLSAAATCAAECVEGLQVLHLTLQNGIVIRVISSRSASSGSCLRFGGISLGPGRASQRHQWVMIRRESGVVLSRPEARLVDGNISYRFLCWQLFCGRISTCMSAAGPGWPRKGRAEPGGEGPLRPSSRLYKGWAALLWAVQSHVVEVVSISS